MILADLAVRIGAGRVEIPERDPLEGMSARKVRQRPFDGQLALAVAVDRPAAGAISEIGVSRGSPYVAHVDENTNCSTDSAAIASRTPQRAADVVAEIPGRFPDRLAHVEERGKVHHGGNPMAHGSRSRTARDIGDVALDELTIADGLAMPGDQIVERNDPVAGAVERLARVAADDSLRRRSPEPRRAQRPKEKYVNPRSRMCSGE